MKKILPYISLLVISCLMAYSIYEVATTQYCFTYEHYIGLVLILVALIAIPFNQTVNRYATFVVLLLSTFGQAAFTTTISRTSIWGGISNAKLTIVLQPYCLLLLILFLIFNWEWFKGLVRIFVDWLNKGEQERISE
ncbi:hypothetical protein ACE38W_07215 [Chitinophaga sp. Hz27]|uniref:hypothetical protein n=1 Tax=Chitinophaga sp. Hz27 TaxID=3347169 RepID=UPI0035D5C044